MPKHTLLTNVETYSRPLRIPVELYEAAKETTALQGNLQPVNSTIVEAIACGLPMILRKIRSRNRELGRYLTDTAEASKLPATRRRARGKCRSGKRPD